MVDVLLVEDEDAIAEPLVRFLAREGFGVSRAADLAAARDTLRASTPDLVLLDVMLPDGDGRDLCREIRRDSDLPVILLTARGEEVDRIVGLELGADDYVVKPFSAGELVARMRAVLRRGRTSTAAGAVANDDASGPRRIAIGDLLLDTGARTLARRGEAVTLTAREFDLLRILMEHAGEVLRRERIMDEVWDPNWFGSTKTLDVHISWLRRKIEEDPAAPRYITTVRGVGFRFATADDLRT